MPKTIVIVKMYWRYALLWTLLVGVCAIPQEIRSIESEEDADYSCDSIRCKGEGYECVYGQCYCAHGYIPTPFQNRCYKCPGLGDKCYGPCCSSNNTLTCWQGVCQVCHDQMGAWSCREPLDHILLISSTQIAMATVLVLGIIATFMLLYKLCAATNLRPLGNSANYEGRLSIGSLQLYVEERLRDAPPRYSRTAPPGTTAIPATIYVNSGFIHDCSVPPPPYAPIKDEETPAPPAQSPQQTIHI